MTTNPKHVYKVRPRKDHGSIDLISDALPFGRLWYGEPAAIGNAKHRSRSCRAVIRVYDEAGNVIETHEHKGKEFGAIRAPFYLNFFVTDPGRAPIEISVNAERNCASQANDRMQSFE